MLKWRSLEAGQLDTLLIAKFLERYRSSVIIVIVASVLLNVMVFAGSAYMLLVYDSVLPSRSIPTLVGLFIILALVYLFQAMFEAIRSEAMLGVANGVRDDLLEAVQYATVSRSLRGNRSDGDGMQSIRDLDQIHTFVSGAGPIALIDLPWVIVFLVVLAALHWALGLTALFGVLVLVWIAVVTNRRTRAGTQELAQVAGQRSAATQGQLRFAEAAKAMGMQARLQERSVHWDVTYVHAQTYLARNVARLSGTGRTFRIFLQSLILTVGALLVIDGKASGGVILASSVLAGRALAPVDQALANWRGLAAARAGWSRLVEAISAHRPPPPRTVTLAPPAGEIVIRDAWLAPPGTQTFVLTGISFSLQPGQALAVIGPSAAGKTSLAKAMLGIWPLARGEIRIDGATYDQWDDEALGASMGYVPQNVELLEGSVGANIARFHPEATSDAIIAAARAAGLHEMILGLEDGYETLVSAGGFELSAGQRQRIGLARALYGDPFLVVLDEPNSNLDAEGDAALAKAIMGVRERGGVVVMITHRPAALGPVTHVAVLNAGRLVDFGARDEVMGRLQSTSAIPPAVNPGRDPAPQVAKEERVS
ncbi:MAG: type I secretion system permease/ATPase [Novosphingobium sp.]